jgi:serine/threonine protein kinase
MTDLAGRRIGEFEIVRELGRGGMGIVYEAVQTSLGRRVALKILGPGLGLTPRAVDRFRREAAAAAKLHHTNIVPVYATGETDGAYFYAMELIDGPSLHAVIRQMHPIADTSTEPRADADATGPYIPVQPTPPRCVLGSGPGTPLSAERFDRAAAMIADVADALHHAHQNGVTHRDIKPPNLLLSSDGRLSVTDFGLARMLEQPGMTITGEFVGTPAYMSPEQITAGRIPVDHRTDIYSLGATLYELLALRPPFRADGRDKLLAMVIQKEPAAPRSIEPKIPRDLETICLKCLEKDPDRRYQNAKELADDLRRYVNRFAILARRAGPLTRLKKWLRRNPALSAAGLVIVFALGTAGFFAWRAHESEQQRLVEDRKREAEVAAEKRQLAMDKAILSAMSGQLADADAALLEAERLGASLAERRFVAGILSQYRGDAESAKRLLLEACGERPDWLAPRAFLTVVCNYAQDWERSAVHGNAALELKPVTAEDYLFRGYMIGFNNAQRGLPDVEEAWRRRRSVLAQFIRAEVLMTLADDTGSIKDAEAARDALRSARSLMGDAPMAAVSNLYLAWVGCNNCRLHGRDEQARQWLTEAAADFHAAQAYRAHPGALHARTRYLYLRDGTAQSLDEENREAGRKSADGSACLDYLGSLFQRGKTDDALEYLRTVRDNGTDIRPFARIAFLLDRGVDPARAECRKTLAGGVRSRYYEFRPYLCDALSLGGMPDEARRQAKALCEKPLVTAQWDEFTPCWRRVAAHAYEGTPLNVAAEIGDSRWKRLIAYDTLGFAALGRGERDKARDWLRKAAEHPPVFSVSYLWMQAIRVRVINDPSWPPWLVEKK